MLFHHLSSSPTSCQEQDRSSSLVSSPQYDIIYQKQSSSPVFAFFWLLRTSICSSGSCFDSFEGGSTCGGGVDCGGGVGGISDSDAFASSSNLPDSGWFAFLSSDRFSSNVHAVSTEAIIINSFCWCSWNPCLRRHSI